MLTECVLKGIYCIMSVYLCSFIFTARAALIIFQVGVSKTCF